MQPVSEIITYPIDLSEFGATPTGETQFRIVRASSRIDKLIHQGKLHTLPRYAEHGSKWILERWLPVDRLLGKTRAEWDAMFAGPMFMQARPEYPADGDFEYVYHWDEAVNATTARKVSAMILFDETNFTNDDRLQAVKVSEESKAADKDAVMTEKLGEIMSRPEEKPWAEPVSSIPARPRVLLSKEN